MNDPRTRNGLQALLLCKKVTMSSGFISGGTTEAPLERSDEWLAAQKDIEANALRRAELARQQGGKSLFETLEANKGISSLPEGPMSRLHWLIT